MRRPTVLLLQCFQCMGVFMCLSSTAPEGEVLPSRQGVQRGFGCTCTPRRELCNSPSGCEMKLFPYQAMVSEPEVESELPA